MEIYILFGITVVVLIVLMMVMSNNLSNSQKNTTDMLVNSQKSTTDMQDKRLSELNTQLTERNNALQKSVSDMLVQIESRLKSMQDDNNKKLEEMRTTVDEKLQKTLDSRISESFKLVSERLEQVYKGLGEMQTLATGVGDLKKVLSNVKTRGILGEIQLGAILEQILSPEQYDTNIATKKNSTNVVEFAIKLPGDENGCVYLPIDSKFPADAYTALLDATDTQNQEQITAAANNLERNIKVFAKSIHDKYVSPPETTDFAIMFLPFEGLYAEVVKRGMIEELQEKYKIVIAGPTTMAALLNSLQMGFKTLAIQKRSSEVWNVLGAVKTEFDKFASVLDETKRRLDQANSELDKLVGVRTRQIQRKLNSVTSLADTTGYFLDEGADENEE